MACNKANTQMRNKFGFRYALIIHINMLLKYKLCKKLGSRPPPPCQLLIP